MEPTSQSPDVLYHYCLSAALPEILRTGVLWLTHQAGLNDLREHVWPVPFIRHEIKRRKTADTEKRLDEIAQQFDVMMFGNNLFVGSFSSDGDVLSQWRAYAMDGDGFAIGFSRDAFKAMPQIPCTSTVDDHTVGLLKVQYDDEVLREAIAQIFDHHLSLNPAPGDLSITCAYQLRQLALSFKNPAFREEREWRITYSPLITTHPEKRDLQIIGALKTIHFRLTRYGVVPYFEMPFGQATRENAIAEVVIGPKNGSRLMEMHLRALGYCNASVRHSSASYR